MEGGMWKEGFGRKDAGGRKKDGFGRNEAKAWNERRKEGMVGKKTARQERKKEGMKEVYGGRGGGRERTE